MTDDRIERRMAEIMPAILRKTVRLLSKAKSEESALVALNIVAGTIHKKLGHGAASVSSAEDSMEKLRALLAKKPHKKSASGKLKLRPRAGAARYEAAP
jgi:hypothetical protein